MCGMCGFAGRAEDAQDLDVVLVGPYPPPFGGISAHIARLSEAIRAEGMTVGVLNHFRGADNSAPIVGELRRSPLRYWRALRRADARIVHYHHARWSTLLATALALRRSSSSTVATFHGLGLEPYLRSRVPGVSRLTRRALRTFDVLIAVSVEAERILQAALECPISVLPAYIPPREDYLTLSAEAEAFLRRGANLVVAAYRLTVDRSGRTIYGLETAIDSFAAIAAIRPDVQLAMFLAQAPRSRRESDRLGKLIARVNDASVRGRIGVFCGEPLAPALRMAALYLRPTLADGDAVSIREALAAGVPVLASDVVVRPEGVRSLPLELSCWTSATEEALAGRHQKHPPAVADSLAELMEIYDRLLRRGAQSSAIVMA
jgi:glycosyltransferase involved in cell wall biosynthesis